MTAPPRENNLGLLEVICGCMFSGKTEELIKLIRRAQFAKKQVQIFKPALDNRYKLNFIVSHNNLKLPCEIIENSSDILKALKPETNFIAVDEVQFLDENIVGVLNNLANKGIHVICAGLDTDWQGNPFYPMPTLLATADIVRKQYAVCTDCGDSATRSQRTVQSTSNILVGSGEIYKAKCRKHFSPFEKHTNFNPTNEVEL